MSDCIHTVYKDGKVVLQETMNNKGLSFEERIDFSKPDEKEKQDIWTVRRELGELH